MSQLNIITTELDPDLLSTSFEVQTNWHVLTGAACSGKTTLIDLFAQKGFQTAPETARQFIDKEIASGRRIEEIILDATTEPSIEEMQLRIEHGLQWNDVVFLDRALPDSITFRRLAGHDPNGILAECFHHRYAFILDRLPFQLNGARVEDDAFKDILDEWLVRDYSALGYHVVRVPVLPPEERLTFILERFSPNQ
jgi:predicted ATPase